jgi:hypothetical protein
MKVIGVLMVALALASGILPQFTDCSSQGRAITLPNGKEIDMKCHWTARAEAAMAVPLLATGVAMTASRRKQMLRMLGIMGVLLGAGVILLPTQLIGVCGSADMLCNSLMRPALTLTGSLAVVLGAVAIVRSTVQVEDSAA